MIIKEGEIFILSAEEYSDRETLVVRATKSIDIDSLEKEMQAAYPADKKPKGGYDYSDIAKAIIEKYGLVVVDIAAEIHLGAYSEASVSRSPYINNLIEQ